MEINFISSLFLYVLLVGFCESSVPGIYIFGDSLVDVGNNNYLPRSLAKANNPHNGLDFPTGKATGRFSNGKNAADFVAEKVGLPSPPPYLSLRSKFPDTGVSLASGGAGILNGTDEQFGQSIPLISQVGYYYAAVHDQLVGKLGSDIAQAHLSKSIYLVVIGGNDLLDYFIRNSRLAKQYSPQEYIDLMISTLKGSLKRLYELGARKFVSTAVPMIGCIPAQRRQNATSGCNVQANIWTMKYNDMLKALLEELKTESSDIQYSYFNTYSVMDSVIQNPKNYGISEIKVACCGLGTLNADYPCRPVSRFCSNRKTHLYWDLYHPTEYIASIFADLIYNGSSHITSPENLQQLINT